jgi:hypothetical protein
MRLLLLEHYSKQDIDGLQKAIAADPRAIEARVMSYQRLRHEVLKVIPDADDIQLEDYPLPERQAGWKAYERHLEGVFEELYAEWPFDAFVTPSDIFPYVRVAKWACQRLGVPFIVVQKETTVAEGTMEEETVLIRDYTPFAGHHMTVCSERHREYWLRAGTDPALISVTGQPRFDFYANTPPPSGERTLLFFSYHLYAYAEVLTGEMTIWRKLHDETERQLWKLAEEGWQVAIKPHPQQPNWCAEMRRMLDEMPESARKRVTFVPKLADTRKLIADASVIVGFQTTALLEAMLAGRPTVYTGWDERAIQHQAKLIPFHDWGELIDLVPTEDDLADVVRSARAFGPGTPEWERRRDIFVEQLGPVDGRCGARTLDAIAEQVELFAAERTPEQAQVRADARARRPLATRLAERAQVATRVALDRVNNRYPCFVGPIATVREAARRIRPEDKEEAHAHT